jgi:hypothetical protein
MLPLPFKINGVVPKEHADSAGSPEHCVDDSVIVPV